MANKSWSKEKYRDYIRQWRADRRARGISEYAKEKKRREIEVGGLPRVGNIAGLTLKDFGMG